MSMIPFFYLYSGYAHRTFMGVVRSVQAAEALCRESCLPQGSFVIMRSRYNAYRYRFFDGHLEQCRR